jgi:hypothetical protein
VMDRALQRDVALRYQSAGEFGRALVAAVKSMPTAPTASKNTPNVKLGGPTVTIPVTRLSSAVPRTMVSPPAASSPSLPSTPSRRTPMLVGAAVLALALVGGWLAFGGAGRGSAGETGAAPATPTPRADSAAAGGTTGASRGAGATGAAESGVGSVSPISISDIAAAAPAPGAAPITSDPGAATAPSPAGTPTVTGAAGSKSYETELVALQESVNDRESAGQAMARLPVILRMVTLARDSAAAQFVEAKALLFTAGATKGCALMRSIKRENLGERLKQPHTEGLQSCEGT